MAANVESMFYVREVPWHGLGTKVEEAPTSEEALRIAGLNWTVDGKPVFDANGNPTRTSDYGQAGYMIEGLSSSTDYYYSLKGQTKEGIIISQSNGVFTTTAQGGTSIDSVNKEIIDVSYSAMMQLIVVKGLEPGDVVYLYDAKGTCIYKQTSCSAIVELDVSQLLDGIYIVRIKDCVQKVFVSRKQ